MLAVGIILSIGALLLDAIGKSQMFYPVFLVVILVFLILFREQVISGCCTVWNRMGEEVTAHTGWVLPEWKMAGGIGMEQGEWFFSFLAGGIGAIICRTVYEIWSLGLAVILPALLTGGMLFTGNKVSVPVTLLAVILPIFILLQYGGRQEREKGAVRYGTVITALLLAVMIPAASLSGIGDTVTEVSVRPHEIIHEKRYETSSTTLPEGNLSVMPEDVGENTALIVTSDIPETMYLRGFTGAVFEDGIWRPLDTGILAEQKDLLYWISFNVFHPDAQFEKASSTEEQITYTVSVQNVNACSSYLYVPFTMTAGSYLQAENLNQGGVQAEGTRVYTFENIADGAGQIQAVLEQLRESGKDTAEDYLKAENAYRKFIYEHYLQVSPDMMDDLGEIWKEALSRFGTKEELTPIQAQECVLDVLEYCFPDNKEDKREHLPLEQVDGTGYQYATIAVMTLRYFGIPARYAEGYILSEEMAKKAEPGKSIELSGSCGGAWAEVYQDGIGWVPMALTPGMEEEKYNSNKEDGDGTETEIKEGQELKEEMNQNPDEPEPEGGSLVKIAREMTGTILLILVLLLLLLVFVILRRKYILKKRKRSFEQEDPKEAVGWIFADTALLLKEQGFDRRNGSMEDLYNPIKERFGEEYAYKFREMLELNGEALFSSHLITEEQRKEALDFHQVTTEYLRDGNKWPKRLFLKWIRCLY